MLTKACILVILNESKLFKENYNFFFITGIRAKTGNFNIHGRKFSWSHSRILDAGRTGKNLNFHFCIFRCLA